MLPRRMARGRAIGEVLTLLQRGQAAQALEMLPDHACKEPSGQSRPHAAPRARSSDAGTGRRRCERSMKRSQSIRTSFSR